MLVFFLFEGGFSGVLGLDGFGEGVLFFYVLDFFVIFEGFVLIKVFIWIIDLKMCCLIVDFVE